MQLFKKHEIAPLGRQEQGFRAATWIVAGAAVCFSIASCGPDRREIIQREVSSRVAEFRKRKALECKNALFGEAERMVDSLLLSEAKAALADSLLRGRPTKPPKPAQIPPVDSAVVKPIFNDPKSKGE